MTEFNLDQIKKFVKFGLYSALIVSILVIIDAKLLGGGKIFRLAMSNGISGVRGGIVRIFTYSFITTFAYFYLLSSMRFQKKGTVKLLALICWLIISYQLFFCNMTRQLLLMISMTTIIFLFNLKGVSKVIVGSVICSLVMFTAIAVLNNSNMLENSSVSKVIQDTKYEAMQTEKGNIAIRLNAIEYFYPYFKKTGFLGMGMMSFTDKNSPVNWAVERGYLFADLGFFAILFRYGIFSIIFIIFVLWKIFKDLMVIQKTEDIESKVIVNCLIYLFISKIIFLPSSTIFFSEGSCLYYGILFYFIYRLKSGVIKQDNENVGSDIKLTSKDAFHYAK